MPELVELHQEWKDKGVRVQTVSIDGLAGGGKPVKTVGEVEAFAKKRDFALPIAVLEGDPSELGPLGEHIEFSGALPTTVLILPGGEVVDTHIGGAKKKAFEAARKKKGR